DCHPELVEGLRVNASFIPTNELKEAIIALKTGEYLAQNNTFIAGKPNDKNLFDKAITAPPTKQIKYPWDIIFLNDAQIR
ncbi:putative sugar nucleotidyl transferase, partial [Streptococcus suis]|uniref:putative sugar nucleotidyl transferase n=1 Tax=Streptococcus suis TaxID=1307 RepID=UPI00370A7D49